MIRFLIHRPIGVLITFLVFILFAQPQCSIEKILHVRFVKISRGKSVVFTLEEGLAKWNYVTVGMESEVEIKDGITVDQMVIVSNNLQLAHDAPIMEEN